MGTQMKPRGEHKEDPQAEKEASTDAVQEEAPKEVIDEQWPDVETPPSQGAETAEKEPKTFFGATPPGGEELRALMGKPEAETPQPDNGEEKFEREFMGNWPPKAVVPTPEEERETRGGVVVDGQQAFRNVVDSVKERVGIGQQSNGDLGVVVMVPEYYVTSVKDFAESDGGKSVEQWCTEFFIQHLEAYCTPMKGR